MSRSLTLRLLLAAVLPTVGFAAPYSTTFDTIAGGDTLSDPPSGASTDGWTTNDVAGASAFAPGNLTVGQGDFVGLFGGYSQDENDNWGYIGGGISRSGSRVRPGVQTVYLHRDFSLNIAGTIQFTVEMALIDSTAISGTRRDQFGWSFQSGSVGSELFQIAFLPTTVGPTQVRAITLLNASGSAVTNATYAMNYNSRYLLNATVTPSGGDIVINASVQSYDVGNATWGASTVVINNQTMTGNASSNVTRIAATRRDGNSDADDNPITGSGDNSMLFNNYSAIPEPTSLLSLGLGLSFLAARRRRVRPHASV